MDAIDDIRIATAFYGGVALAIYEAGVAHELYRAVSADGVYKKALEPGKRLTVDVISGTSAGGITGALLGHALATGASFAGLRKVWIERGDIASLLFKPNRSVDGLLDGSQLRDIIHQNLPTDPANPLVEDLVAFITATDLVGRAVWYHDDLGHRILITNSREFFQFSGEKLRRQPGESAGAYRQRLLELATAARATSAFPGAFSPQLIERRWYADGGVLDNKPLGLALRGIRDKKAYYQTHRKLLFVEPDPAGRAREPNPDVTPHPLEVLVSVIGLAFEDSIYEDLRNIDEINARLGWYAKYRDIVDLFLATRRERGDDILRDQTLQGPLEDLSYQVRFHGLFLKGDLLPRYWLRLMRRLMQAGIDPLLLIRQLVTEGAAEVDLHRRWYRWLITENLNIRIEAHRPRASDDEATRAHNEAFIARTLGQVRIGEKPHKQWLYEEISAPTDHTWHQSKITEVFAEWLGRWEEWRELPPEALRVRVEELVSELHRIAETTGLVALLRNNQRAMEDRAARDSIFAEIYVPFQQFRYSDVALFIASSFSDLAGRGRIDLIRISPRDADNLRVIGAEVSEEEAVRRKLAGEILGHFGGFLDRNWRRNDYVWGRLDATEILLRMIDQTGTSRPKPELEKLIQQAQKEILEDELREARREKGQAVEPLPDLESPEGMQAIREIIGHGSETFADLPALRRFHLLSYVMQTLTRMFEGQGGGLLPALRPVLRGFRAVASPVRYVTEPLLMFLGPTESRQQRTLWRLVWVGIGLLLLAFLIGFLASKYGLLTSLVGIGIITAVLGAVYLLGAMAGRGGIVWLALVLVFALGVWLQPFLARVWAWLAARVL